MVAATSFTWSLLLLAASTCTEALKLHNKQLDRQVQRTIDADLLRSRGILPPRQLNESDPSIDQWVTLPLDHSGEDDRTFDNRYWISTSGYQGAGSPIFIYDNGEAAGDSSAIEYGFFKQMVDKFGGIGISWEHRYYGESISFNITTDTDPEDMKFLTVEQALADVAVFASNFSHPDFADIDLTPASTPWIFVGGSYPGIRAALMRELYPDIIYAAYASSAPVEARVNMSSYFDPIWDGMHRYGYGNCTRDVQAALLYIDEQLGASNESADAIKQQFLGRNGEKNSNGDFGYALSVLWFGWQNSGADETITSFCDYLETREIASSNSSSNGTSSHSGNGTAAVVAGENGWAPKMGAEWIVQKWAEWEGLAGILSYAECEGNPAISEELADLTKRGDGTTENGGDEDDNESETVDDSDSDPTCDLSLISLSTDGDDISWSWQYCTQWGFLHAANVGPRQLTSAYNTLDYQMGICRRQFPAAVEAGIMPEWPAVEELNALSGGWDMRPSNTFWTGGEFDPWRTLSPLSDDLEDAPMPYLTQKAPKCGVSTKADQLFGYLLPNAEHCFDFDTTPEAKQAQKFFTDALEEWLKCFEPSGGY